uniref:Uncharacterized protein n=1 Tax=Astyanax mexicanus TaxID=7994 RepID=A0A3B1KBV2_ASTMX
ITRTMMLAVPERTGTPPSTAVSIKLCIACSSRIKSAIFDPSLPVCTSISKLSLSLK